MSKSNNINKYAFRWLSALILIVIAVLLFFAFWYNFVQENDDITKKYLLGSGNLALSITMYTLLYIFIGKGLHAFKIGAERSVNVIASVVLTLFCVDVLEVLVSMSVIGNFRYFWKFTGIYFLMFLLQSVVEVTVLYGLITIYRRSYPPLRILMVYGKFENDIEDKMNSLVFKYKVEEAVSYSEGPRVIGEKLKNYDAVLINDVPAKAENKLLKLCFDMDKRVYLIPKISDIMIKSSEELNLLDTPLFLCRNVGITLSQSIIKRGIDIVLSGLALVILSPLMGITALAIKLQDGGPVFFRQERCTINEEIFDILKFRSMIVDAEKDGRPRPAGENDDRITKVGKIIRATRIDELPQLINILKGDMSIVGPRPERIENVRMYSAEIPEFIFRSKVKGGLTGYAQVYGKYNTTPLDKLKLDLYYIMNFSILMDVQIIFETVKIIFQKESTEGFSAERIEKIVEAEASMPEIDKDHPRTEVLYGDTYR